MFKISDETKKKIVKTMDYIVNDMFQILTDSATDEIFISIPFADVQSSGNLLDRSIALKIEKDGTIEVTDTHHVMQWHVVAKEHQYVVPKNDEQYLHDLVFAGKYPNNRQLIIDKYCRGDNSIFQYVDQLDAISHSVKREKSPVGTLALHNDAVKVFTQSDIVIKKSDSPKKLTKTIKKI